MKIVCAAILLALLTACQSPRLQPVDIEASDMCSRCRMAISQKRFAGELLNSDGDAAKFDDIGCMLHYLAGYHVTPAAVFVTDYPSGRWLDAGSAFFVKSSTIQTPMAGGILAFADRAQAEASGKQAGASVLRYRDLGKTE